MERVRVAGAWAAAILVLATAGAVQPALSQTAAIPAGKSAAPAKELASLLQGRRLQSFAARDPGAAGRFVAVFHIPGVQLLVVGATVEPPTQIEIRLYQHDHMGAYTDLNQSMLAKAKVFIEDLVADGLKAEPAQEQAGDSATLGSERHNFDGAFIDPKRRNPKAKITRDDYMKAFTAADDAYVQMLGVLIAALKNG